MIWMWEVREIYQIYIDRFFFVQLVFHICNLRLTSFLLGWPCTYKRIMVVAIFSSLASSAGLLLPLALWVRLMLGMLVSFCVCFTVAYRAYRYTGYGFSKMLLGTFVVSLFLGGWITFLKKWFVGVTNHTLPFFVSVLGSTVGIEWILRYFFRNKRSNVFHVTLKNGDRICELFAFLDTGNGLVEPISHKPVSLVDESVVTHLNAASKGMRVVPYRAVGTPCGFICGYEIESLTIMTKETKILIQKPMIAVGNKIFDEKQGYQMLLHPKLVARKV